MLNADVNCDMTGFEKIGDELREYIGANLESIAYHVKDRAQELCPVDEGDLKKSIKVEKVRTDEFRVVTRDPKAHLVELGHVLEDKKGNVIGHVPPYPFLRPARDEAINELLRFGGKGYDFVKASGVFDSYWRG